MALKTFKPTTPSQRQLVIVDRSELWKGEPVKALTEGLRKKGGRNNTGRITLRHRGGGAKRRYRIIDFKRGKSDVVATVERLEYDPNRTAFIALIKYEDGEQSYILAPQRLKAGDKVVAGEKVDVKPGNAMPVKHMPLGRPQPGGARGQADQGQEDSPQQGARPLHRAPAQQEVTETASGTLDMEGAVHRRLSLKKGREVARFRAQ